jgi:hypothetical protein
MKLDSISVMLAKLILVVSNKTETGSGLHNCTSPHRDVSTFSRGLSRATKTDDVEFNAIRCFVESAIVQA